MGIIDEIVQADRELDLLPGAEPFFFERGDIGCLLLHGFGGTPAVTRYTGQSLADAGITTFGPLLPGHGTRPEDMLPYTAYDWVRAANYSLHLLAERCSAAFVIGLSMGGSLAVHLAATQGQRLQGMVAINAAVAPKELDDFIDVVQVGAPDMVSSQWDQPMSKDPSVEYVYYESYPGRALFSLYGLVKINEALIPRIKIPTLILHSRDDGVTPPIHAEMLLKHVGSRDKHVKWLDNSYHVATLDYDKDIIVEEILRFINDHLA
jgi:carboxylesterase